jgi:RNA polymerase sigma factor (sigma-70 family)
MERVYMKTSQDKVIKAKQYCERVFLHEDFKNPKKTKEIAFKVVHQGVPHLLSQEEEEILFKQMNYFKYKAKRLLDTSNVSEGRLQKAESFIDKAKEIRNFIAECNLRLANQVLKCNVSYYKKNCLIDSLLSDAYFDIIKSVDYFNWTLGNRFSTYATWVIKKNFFRESKENQKRSKRLVHLEEFDSSLQNDGESSLKLELDHKGHQQIVSILLSMLETGDCAKDKKRQVFILEHYFGLNGQDDCTLEEISNKLGITKERVRQLKEKGLDWLRKELNQMNLNYEIIFESVRY